MPDSPAAATPYEVLGVSPTASQDELRRAYRRLLRHTHPDVGGSAERFHAVQIAWERVGNPASRAEYDRHRYSEAEPSPSGSFYAAPAAPGRSAQSGGVRARMYGHPGGQTRQHFLSLIREWAGRGTTLDDPYDPGLVRTAPQEIRHRLAKAIAEESTAQLVSGLGIGFTAWHDVDTGEQGQKLDHVVLGPAGLFAILSEDWGAPVQLRRGELAGDTLAPGESPIQGLEDAARALARSLKVRFTALVVVLPDGAVSEPLTVPRRGRRPTVVTIPRSRLVGLLRDGLPGMDRGSFEKVFELRSRLQNGIRFVQD
ncbi:J domain-containing protein [Cryobacterium tagatosivorans]|uniref:Heat-shock protein n=1 Tax=Cryobacterium tagatosivorans TaxID=1259199 RepID=A0A4R8UDI1_9MICO|nr:J domain-containing protein [Cryobacterium tagatosivorans]TFB49510.1 heat-shock protein [Cryobacterium tagatosivorans]